MAITFNGPDLTIQLDAVTQNYTAQEIYSRWKEWVLDENANWPPAFRVVGGDDLGGSRSPAFFFVRNDLGWTVRRPESNVSALVNGNLVFENPAGTQYTGPMGNFSPTVTVNLTSVANVDIQLILDAIAAMGDDEMREEIRRIYVAHYHKRHRINQTITLYAADGITPLYVFDATDDGSLIDPRFNPSV